jgi:hypothetical protein
MLSARSVEIVLGTLIDITTNISQHRFDCSLGCYSGEAELGTSDSKSRFPSERYVYFTYNHVVIRREAVIDRIANAQSILPGWLVRCQTRFM